MSKLVYKTKGFDGPARVNGYIPEGDEDRDNNYGIQIDLEPRGGTLSVFKYVSAAQARAFAAELVRAADAIDEALRVAAACPTCEGGGCNNCLPEPHNPESEPAPEVG